jgi:hypothetical protein
MVHSELITAGDPSPPAHRLDRAQLACCGAAIAPGARFLHHGPQDGDLGEQTEQAAERAQVAAPETVGQRIEGDDAQEQHGEKDGLRVVRLDHRQHVAAQMGLDPVDGRLQEADVQHAGLELGDGEVEAGDDRRGHGPREQ